MKLMAFMCDIYVPTPKRPNLEAKSETITCTMECKNWKRSLLLLGEVSLKSIIGKAKRNGRICFVMCERLGQPEPDTQARGGSGASF